MGTGGDTPSSDPELTLTVIGNCHCLPLADALALSALGITTDFIDVNFADEPHIAAKINGLYDDSGPETVFSLNLSEQFSRLATPVLREHLGGRLATFTNIHFTGLHPDITYIGCMRRRLRGFFGDYHSKLVLFSFVSRWTPERCLQLFNGVIYERLGYFEAFATSSDDLLLRDAACDVRFAARFLEMVRWEPSLYTVNHPTGRVFLELAFALAEHAGFEFVRHGAVMFQNHLSTNYIWPVYHEIAEHHGLAYRTAPYFVRIGQRASRSIGLEEFVRGSYAAYREAEFDDLAAMAARLPFYPAFRERLDMQVGA
jgi:hypothetical protein